MNAEEVGSHINTIEYDDDTPHISTIEGEKGFAQLGDSEKF